MSLILLSLKQTQPQDPRSVSSTEAIVLIMLSYVSLLKKMENIIFPYHSVDMILNWILIDNISNSSRLYIAFSMNVCIFTLTPLPSQNAVN